MRYKVLLLAAALALGLSTPLMAQETSSKSTAPEAVTHHLDKCPSNVAEFDHSDATRTLVEKCMGRPTVVLPGHGDDTVYEYAVRGGTIILVFVFDRSGAMTHFAGYKKN
jgi:hypothetical protein